MGRKMSKFTIFAVRMKNTRFKVMELYGLGSRQLSYGFWASVLKNDTCTYATYIPDISCDRGFVDELARRCITILLCQLNRLIDGDLLRYALIVLHFIDTKP